MHKTTNSPEVGYYSFGIHFHTGKVIYYTNFKIHLQLKGRVMGPQKP